MHGDRSRSQDREARRRVFRAGDLRCCRDALVHPDARPEASGPFQAEVASLRERRAVADRRHHRARES
jgi:hypothetical protein